MFYVGSRKRSTVGAGQESYMTAFMRTSRGPSAVALSKSRPFVECAIILPTGGWRLESVRWPLVLKADCLVPTCGGEETEVRAFLLGLRESSCREFIYSLRLDHAAHLLNRRSGKAQPLSEIAYGCGFRDYTHFARKSRHRFGYSPRSPPITCSTCWRRTCVRQYRQRCVVGSRQAARQLNTFTNAHG